MLFHNKKNIPTHLLIGVRKSATTWIWKQFTDHPEVCTNPRKEIYFFNKFYDYGIEWYANQFKSNKKIILDATPDYFFNTLAYKIKKTIPESKLFVCLRNPIQRAYSHWKFGRFIKNCKKEFKESWDDDWNFIKTRGMYDVHLESFLKYYELESNFKVFFYDDLLENPYLFIKDIFKFVGVNEHKSFFFKKKWMPGGVSENNREKIYESIDNKKIENFKFIKEYYFDSIKNLEKILGKKTKWLDS
jgi:hypothetical protein